MKIKKKIIKISLFIILGAGLVTLGIYAYFLSWWAYIPFFNNDKAKAESLTVISETISTNTTTFKPSPSPMIDSTPVVSIYITPTPTPSSTPLPTPTPHPGDRDNKFTTIGVQINDYSYHSRDLSIEISKTVTDLITYYVAEVYYRNNENYYSAFSYGEDNDRIQKTSEILEESNGILAVSGDNYNARDYGLIIRNGILYRKHSSTPICSVFDDGTMEVYPRKGETYEALLKNGALHTYSFGPNLLNNGEPIENFEDLTSNYLRNLQPRCAIGIIEPYHYVFVVVDGRAPNYSQGVTMEELSLIMYNLGCTQAYNLDGGGSATMVFNGELINRPQGRHHERKIADAIVFREID